MKVKQETNGKIKILFTWKDIFKIIKNKNVLQFDLVETKGYLSVIMKCLMDYHAKLPKDLQNKPAQDPDKYIEY